MFCNVYTSFESITLSYDVCASGLMKMTELSKSCEECLISNTYCSYNKLDEQCNHCRRKNIKCICLVVFHVIWDMGSSQKKAAKVLKKIDELSSIDDLRDSIKFTVGFGGLHLGKGGTNGFRNFVLNMNGERFGLNVLRALRNGDDKAAEILLGVKN